jgi:ABC-type nitrate/sulfonate/bicarbonate transport system ATPase subunit
VRRSALAIDRPLDHPMDAPMPRDLIQVESVSKTFVTDRGVRPVLENVSLTVERGEFVSVVGFMGCGKSTLLSIMSGLTPPDSGMVRIAGEVVRGVRARSAIVFQNYSLLPWLSAFENVRLAVDSAFPTWPKAQKRDQATRYLEKVGLGNAILRRPGQLSGGMRQRVAIARAFATEPDILFLDDPFGALDALTRANLQQELVQLCVSNDRSVTTIMITNSVDEALLLSDRIVPMTHGPRATLGEPVSVAIAKPRTVAQLLHDEYAVHVRAHVVESLTASVKERRRKPVEIRSLDNAKPAALLSRSEA